METMTDLCLEALRIIADSDNPTAFIQNAKEAAEKIAGKKLSFNADCSKLLRSINQSVTGKYKGWEVVQNNWFHHYNLVDPDDKVRVRYVESDWRRPDFKYFLDAVISLKDNNVNMELFQIVTGENITARKGCTLLKLSDAERKYPNTKSLAAGFYTTHPADERALTPIEDYYNNLALDQINEQIELFEKMGAKSLLIKTTDSSSEGNDTTASAEIPVVVKAGIGASLTREQLESLSIKVEFEGTPVEFDEDLLENYVWCKNDPEMVRIFKSRKSGNKTQNYEANSKKFKKFNFDIRLAASVLGVAEAEITNEYEKISKTTRKLHVIFP